MLLLTAILALGPVQAQTMFPFVIPWDDAVPGTATDVSFLNAMPAGKNGRIVVRNGHFVEEKTGKRVRFLGTNFTGRMAFPSHADADKVAARLAKYGVNVVRFHHLQNDWDLNGGTIWKEDRMHREIDPKQLDRMDYLIAALKKKGIYSNINLQTTRKYFPDMGFPESVLQIPTEFAKKIDKVNRKMIQYQKEYAKQVLDRVNPYTGLKHTQDPAVAFVEINNENSLVGWPGEPPGNGLRQMPEPFRGEIVRLWNAWLKGRYPTRQALTDAWTKDMTPPGPSILTPQNRWTWENQSNGDVEFSSLDNGIRLNIKSNPGPDWHIQTHLAGLNLQNGFTYTLRFRAKSSQENPVRVAATLDQADWRNIGLNMTFTAGPEAAVFEFPFAVSSTLPDHGRIAFAVGEARGTLEITDVSLSPGIANADAATAGFEAGTIDLPVGGTKRQMEDYTDFLAETETAYTSEMRNFLRKDLQSKSLLVDTQQSWGGMTSFLRERDSDFADNHSYFEHPSFAKSWDPVEWVIPNTPMVDKLAKGYGELGGLAQYRVAGRPYAVSEYNHPAPNDYRAEMMPLIMTFAALQDWDAIYTFDYGATGTGLNNEKIQGFFGIATDPTKMAFHPSTALMFRTFQVPTLQPRMELLVSTNKPWLPSFTAWSAWGTEGLPDLWKTRIGVMVDEEEILEPIHTPSTRSATFPGKEHVPPVTRIENPDKPVYLVDTPKAKAIVGHVGGGKSSLGGLSMQFPTFGNGFATVTAAAIDDKPLANSSRVLLTLVGKVENQNMVWKDATRTSVGDQWGNGPTMAEGIPCTVAMNVGGPRKVYALDGNGRRKATIPSKLERGMLTFTVGSQYKTLWYEIAK